MLGKRINQASTVSTHIHNGNNVLEMKKLTIPGNIDDPIHNLKKRKEKRSPVITQKYYLSDILKKKIDKS